MDLSTYIFFDGRCEEAFKHYENVLGGKIEATMRYADVPDGPSNFKGDQRIIHMALHWSGRVLMGSDVPPDTDLDKGRHGFRVAVIVDTPDEAERIFKGLSEGGTIAMPMGETFFSRRFGMCEDKFGTPWMVNCAKDMTTAQSKPFIASRTFDAPLDRVWKAFTDPAEMQKWWGPKGVTIIASKMDFRPGGTYLYGMRPQIGPEMWGRMVYREIAPQKQIVFVNSFSDPQGGLTRHPMAPTWPIELLSVFDFNDVGDGKTTFTVTWSPLDATPQEREAFDNGHASMTQGWAGTLDSLQAYLAKA